MRRRSTTTAAKQRMRSGQWSAGCGQHGGRGCAPSPKRELGIVGGVGKETPAAAGTATAATGATSVATLQPVKIRIASKS